MDYDTQLRARQRLKDDFVYYARNCLKIREESGAINPFELNRSQLHIHKLLEDQKLRTGKVRALVLKGRQQGCSTLIEGRYYWLVTHRKGVRAFILTHEAEATKNLFEMANRYHEHCMPQLKHETQTNNSNELLFSRIDSGYRLGTAGNKSVGRSATIQYLHGSEVAFWENASEHAKGIMQTVPGIAGTEIILESTANGVGNYFHEQWQKAEAGESDFIAIFTPWFWKDEYSKTAPKDFLLTDEEYEIKQIYELTNDQLNWRRHKIAELSVGGMNGEKAFKQEYPNNAAEAFIHSSDDTFIDATVVARAAKTEVEGVGSLVIGVDVARHGNDRTCIIRRRGRKMYNLQTFRKLDNMEVANIVHRIIEDEKPDKVFIDVIGIGSGVVDRLKELGHDDVVVGINSAVAALNQQLYHNKRNEMWGEFKKWLLDFPCEIPDDPALHSDICGIKEKAPDSNGRLVLEKKEEMKKRGIRSPDCADAACLTFAMPLKALYKNTTRQHEEVASKITSFDNRVNVLRKKAYVK